jgi:quercetin dioxygenase-like cupin family protein
LARALDEATGGQQGTRVRPVSRRRRRLLVLAAAALVVVVGAASAFGENGSVDTPSEDGALVTAAIFRFAPGGRIRRHPGTYPQIIAVLEGSGEVRGANGVDEPIGAGEAVFLHAGEDHEAKSEAGLTALIIEGESLDRYRLVAGRRS